MNWNVCLINNEENVIDRDLYSLRKFFWACFLRTKIQLFFLLSSWKLVTCILAEIILTKNSCCATHHNTQFCLKNQDWFFFYFILPSHSVTPFDRRWQICPTVHGFSRRHSCTMGQKKYVCTLDPNNNRSFFCGVIKLCMKR